MFWLTLLAPLLVTKPCQAAGVALADAKPAQQKAADKKLADGEKLLKAGKPEKALAAFDAAHDIVADPRARLQAGRVHLSQGELLKAHAAFEEAIAEAEDAIRSDGKYRDTLKQARSELRDLEGVLAKLTIHVRYAPEGTKVTVDGEALGERKVGEAFLIAPGEVKVRAVTPDGREASRQVTLSAGQDARVDLAFVREDAAEGEALPTSASAGEKPDSEPEATSVETPSSSGGKRTAAFVAGGVGLAGLATFGVLGAMSNAKYKELSDACPSNRCGPGQQGTVDDGKLFQTLANVGLVVGIVGLGTSVTLFVLSRPGPAEQQASRVELHVGFRSLELRGRFQ